MFAAFIATGTRSIKHDCEFPDYDQGAADTVPFLDAALDTEKNSPLGKKLYRNESESTSIDYTRDFGPLHHLMNVLSNPTSSNERWKRNKNVTIVFFGGSQTTGNGINSAYIAQNPNQNTPTSFCNSTYNVPFICEYSLGQNAPCLPCAFPRRFEYWLQHAYPEWHINVYNLAKGGTHSGGILSELGAMLKAIPSPIDLAIVNYAGNDYENNNREAEFVAATFETLLRSLMYRYHMPLVAMEMMATPRFESHERVLAYYGVPTIRYNEASIASTLAFHQHLPWPYHQLFANFLAYFWSTEARASCKAGLTMPQKQPHHEMRHNGRYKLTHRPPMPELLSLRRFMSPECVTPITALRAEAPWGDSQEWKHSFVHIMPAPAADSVPRTAVGSNTAATAGTATGTSHGGTGTWVFGEDKKGTRKLGWFIDSLSGGSIKFTIKVGT